MSQLQRGTKQGPFKKLLLCQAEVALAPYVNAGGAKIVVSVWILSLLLCEPVGKGYVAHLVKIMS